MAVRARRAWAWVVGPPREPNPPPEWVFRPKTGIAATACWIGLTIAVSVGVAAAPIAILIFALWIILAVEVYEDRRALALPYFWWSSAVGTFGPLVFLMYVQNRRESLENMRHEATAQPLGPTDGIDASSPRAAWYPDPLGRARLRWWNGAAWTRDVAG